jgi:glycosyltransferase involved in cell wall biosynthesis
LLFLSRLDPKKGLDLLIAAFARVRNQHPGALLVIAGDGSPAFVQDLKQQSRRLGVESAIEWAGFLKDSVKDKAFRQADIFVLPSYSENFGVAVVEAMGAGLPVIVSDQVGLHQEIARAEAGLVTQCTVDSVEQAILRLLQDPGLRVSMARRSIELAQTFSREAVAQQFVQLYARIGRRQQSVAA